MIDEAFFLTLEVVLRFSFLKLVLFFHQALLYLPFAVGNALSAGVFNG